ncbi:hypothetical protein PUNSTDRAFT_138338 [Punctularia strigosozonata HHB-11173 SS5]|uniref:Uncharacterized protein n=1 Tax=Punctularia strigosozonata (strain HHB-11173) TaxID=741275 RepID=R7S4B8_PUNST|nr:uncharacterized protein PUNSTDRAFT_138338 [Punctularia strigosozonata HHB-11173 SS5]EIN04694.1 hypothetical protein PUNSTDRAFT_138338 [Punctularia strigosozonata HHB-11173 SS5]
MSLVSNTTPTAPRVVEPGFAKPGEPILQPDDVKYPWYKVLVLPWSEKGYREVEDTKKLIDTFEPLLELPPEFDPWSQPLKYPPPKFYYGWPVDSALTLEYARQLDLVCYWAGTGAVECKSQTEVEPDDQVSDEWTLYEVEQYLKPVVSLVQSYGARSYKDPYLLVWSLYTNWTSPARRPTTEQIAGLQEELGYEEGPRWFLTCDV